MTTPTPRWTATVVAASLAIVAGLTACDPEPPPSPPTAPPSSTSSPAASPSASPTVSEEEQAYAAAKEAYTNANRIIDTTINEGAAKYPESLNEWVDPQGDYYQSQVTGLKALNESSKADGLRYAGLSKVAEMFPPKGAVYNPNQISMYACVDSTSLTTVEIDTGEVVERGDIVAGVLVFKRTGKEGPDGLRAWRVWGYQNDDPFEVVDKCKEPAS